MSIVDNIKKYIFLPRALIISKKLQLISKVYGVQSKFAIYLSCNAPPIKTQKIKNSYLVYILCMLFVLILLSKCLDGVSIPKKFGTITELDDNDVDVIDDSSF